MIVIRRGPFHRAIAGLAVAGIAAGIAATPVAAGAGDNWAYAVVRSGSNPPATPAAKDRGVSADWGSLTVERTGTGRYRIAITAFFGQRGVPLVTPLSGKPRTCTPDVWPLQTPGQYTDITITCRDRFGDDADSGFTVSFREIESVPGNRTTSYLFSDQAIPGAARRHRAVVGARARVGHQLGWGVRGAGVYDVTMPGRGHIGGIV
ncbi:MAG: hypothetical protein ACKOTZ_05530, partial [Chloroflexota bacterium]